MTFEKIEGVSTGIWSSAVGATGRLILNDL